jgi:hypothetical protein
MKNQGGSKTPPYLDLKRSSVPLHDVDVAKHVSFSSQAARVAATALLKTTLNGRTPTWSQAALGNPESALV